MRELRRSLRDYEPRTLTTSPNISNHSHFNVIRSYRHPSLRCGKPITAKVTLKMFSESYKIYRTRLFTSKETIPFRVCACVWRLVQRDWKAYSLIGKQQCRPPKARLPPLPNRIHHQKRIMRWIASLNKRVLLPCSPLGMTHCVFPIRSLEFRAIWWRNLTNNMTVNQPQIGSPKWSSWCLSSIYAHPTGHLSAYAPIGRVIKAAPG